MGQLFIWSRYYCKFTKLRIYLPDDKSEFLELLDDKYETEN